MVWGKDRPCRARPVDRSLVAEDRSAEGVRDQGQQGSLASGSSPSRSPAMPLACQFARSSAELVHASPGSPSVGGRASRGGLSTKAATVRTASALCAGITWV